MGGQYPDDFAAFNCFRVYREALGISAEHTAKDWEQIKIDNPELIEAWVKVAEKGYQVIKNIIADSN